MCHLIFIIIHVFHYREFESAQTIRIVALKITFCVLLLTTVNDQLSALGVLHDLLPFVQLKKRKKHTWGSVTFSEVAGF